MQRRVIVKTVGKGLDVGASCGRQLAVVTVVQVVPNTQPLDQKIDRRRITAINGGVGSAVKGDGVVDDRPVVFALGEGKAKGGVDVAFANDMWHPHMIALDHHIVALTERQIIGRNKSLHTTRQADTDTDKNP